VTNPAEPSVESLRGRLSEAAQQIPGLDALIAIVAEACKPTRTIRIEGQVCEKCDHRCQHIRYYKISDFKAAKEALQFVLEQTEGRPGVAGVEEAGVIVRRVVVGLDE